ncbi:hypothetical protein L4F31_16530 [Vibrio paracholerae]|uniref:hypothetical protein n=1 Tax=Vibrio paracholerae TaxID=650003 RepID=UPI0020945682|nr:hypothetical protein [Vibrio paracholerae]MCO7024829.1 hypothetical protein [Vibrio paracholerae]
MSLMAHVCMQYGNAHINAYTYALFFGEPNMRVLAFLLVVIPIAFVVSYFANRTDLYSVEKLDAMEWQQEDNQYRVAKVLTFENQRSGLKCPGFRFKQLTDKADGLYWVQCYSDHYRDYYYNYVINTKSYSLKKYNSQLAMLRDLGLM